MKTYCFLKISFLFVFMCMISCNKDKLDDIRKIYIGKYQVVEKISGYGICFPLDLIVKDTVISINYGLTDSTLSVLGRDVYLDSEGFCNQYHYWLRLWNDSISSTFMNGGLGCGKYEKYEGYKITDKP
jgi:hypothetical protein